MRSTSALLRFFALAIAARCAGCTDSDPKKATIPPAPAECAALPSLRQIQPDLVAALDDATQGGTLLEPKDAYRGVVPLGVGYALDTTDDNGQIVVGTGPLLFRSRAEVDANKNLASVADMLQVDWSKEAIVVVREHPREAMYRYVVLGTELVVAVAKATPCLAEIEVKSFFNRPDLGTRILRVPNTVLTARAQTSETRYRLVSPRPTGTCQRAAGAAALGGGSPSVARGPQGIRLYFNGFSAMTGNVFFGESSDGKTFTPNGWDEGHLSIFAGRRDRYADVYSPFVEHVADGWRMTATTRDIDYVREANAQSMVTLTGLVEMTSPDGRIWSEGKQLFPPTKDGEAARFAPARIAVGDEERLYYSTSGAIRVARRRGTRDFVEDAAPVLTPADDLDDYDALGHGSPDLARVGSRLVLFTTAYWGGLSNDDPWRAGIAYAVSDDDGATFHRGPAPLLLPETEDEAGGLASPSALVTDGALSLFFSSINRQNEPVVKRADCILP